MSLLDELLRWWHYHHLRSICLLLHSHHRGFEMNLSIVLGATVSGQLAGHSSVNGASIPDSATITLVSSNPAVATVPATLTVPTGGATTITVPVTVLAVGTTDITATVTTTGSPLTSTATLTVTPVPSDLTSVVLTLTSP